MIETGFDIQALQAGFIVVLIAALIAAVPLAGWAVFVRIVEA